MMNTPRNPSAKLMEALKAAFPGGPPPPTVVGIGAASATQGLAEALEDMLDPTGMAARIRTVSNLKLAVYRSCMDAEVHREAEKFKAKHNNDPDEALNALEADPAAVVELVKSIEHKHAKALDELEAEVRNQQTIKCENCGDPKCNGTRIDPMAFVIEFTVRLGKYLIAHTESTT